MNRSTIQTLAACLITLTIGAFAGSWRSPFSKPRAQSRAPTTAPARKYDDAFAEALRTETGVKRWLLLLSEVEKATAADMPALIRLAGGDSAMVRMLAAHWADLDPSHMLNGLYADALLPEGSPAALPNRADLREVLFEQWTKRDIAGAIEALTNVPNFPGLDTLRTSVAASILKMDAEQGLRAMKQWKVWSSEKDYQQAAGWAARDPRHAAEVVLKIGSDFAAFEGWKIIGSAWGDRNPAEGMKFAAGLEPVTRASLGSAIMRRWAARDLAGAVAFAVAQPDTIRAGLAKGLMETWGAGDPAAALAWSQQNLKGLARIEVIAGLVKTAAEKDLAGAADIVAGMAPGATQNRASASIFATWFGKGKSEHAAALEWLATVPDAEARRAAIEPLEWDWIKGDPDGARDFIAGPLSDLVSPSMISSFACYQAAKNPQAAMEWAHTLPADRADRARSNILEQWLSVRPDDASAYVRAMPAGAEHDQAIQSISERVLLSGAEDVARWWRDLSGGDRKTARAVFDNTKLSDERRQKLDAALKGR